MTGCLQTLIISYIWGVLSSPSTSTSQLTVQYSKLCVKSSHLRKIFLNLDVLSEYQFTDDDVQSPKAKCKIQWVYGFQYLSIHSPPEPLKPSKIKTFLSQVLQTTKAILCLEFCLLVGAPVSDTRGALEVTKLERDHWHRTCPPRRLGLRK